jgi:nitroreductase
VTSSPLAKDSVFFRRHSLRAYLDRPVPSGVLEGIFEAVRWSPSCSNNQPWRFVFAVDAKRREAFTQALSKGNLWAAKAPVLVAVCARPQDDYTRQDDPVAYYQFDCGLAVMSLLLAATEAGLMAHPMAGYNAPGIKEALEVPDEYHVICIVALGYEGPPELLDERTRAKDAAPRTRGPLRFCRVERTVLIHRRKSPREGVVAAGIRIPRCLP